MKTPGRHPCIGVATAPYVIMTSFEHSNFVLASVRSVLQTCKEVEYVLNVSWSIPEIRESTICFVSLRLVLCKGSLLVTKL